MTGPKCASTVWLKSMFMVSPQKIEHASSVTSRNSEWVCFLYFWPFFDCVSASRSYHFLTLESWSRCFLNIGEPSSRLYAAKCLRQWLQSKIGEILTSGTSSKILPELPWRRSDQIQAALSSIVSWRREIIQGILLNQMMALKNLQG